VGLIAREIEAAGVPTLVMTSALDITSAVAPPRSVYLHFPLGHQGGRPGDPVSQVEVARAALRAASAMTRPGEIVRLPFEWEGEPGWEAVAYTAETVPVGPDGKPDRGA